MSVKFEDCPCCGGKVEDNCTPNYAECWCTVCGLMLKQYGKEAAQKLAQKWNTRRGKTTTVKPLSNGFEKCECKAKIAAGFIYCPYCGKKIIREVMK